VVVFFFNDVKAGPNLRLPKTFFGSIRPKIPNYDYTSLERNLNSSRDLFLKSFKQDQKTVPLPPGQYIRHSTDIDRVLKQIATAVKGAGIYECAVTVALISDLEVETIQVRYLLDQTPLAPVRSSAKLKHRRASFLRIRVFLQYT
jgi:hypothetical protein